MIAPGHANGADRRMTPKPFSTPHDIVNLFLKYAIQMAFISGLYVMTSASMLGFTSAMHGFVPWFIRFLCHQETILFGNLFGNIPADFEENCVAFVGYVDFFPGLMGSMKKGIIEVIGAHPMILLFPVVLHCLWVHVTLGFLRDYGQRHALRNTTEAVDALRNTTEAVDTTPPDVMLQQFEAIHGAVTVTLCCLLALAIS